MLLLYIHMQKHQVCGVLKAQLHTGVMKPHIARGRLHRSAQGGFLAHHQGKHAKVGQVSALRHQQAEGFLAGKACRLFQQPADRIAADQ
ncbi:hypothetical protein D9M71_844220 [compost metagenome]